MTIDQMIANLQAIRSAHGNLEVFIANQDGKLSEFFMDADGVDLDSALVDAENKEQAVVLFMD